MHQPAVQTAASAASAPSLDTPTTGQLLVSQGTAQPQTAPSPAPQTSILGSTLGLKSMVATNAGKYGLSLSDVAARLGWSKNHLRSM